MIYKTFFKAASEPDRNYDITYCIAECENDFYIEAFIEGSSQKATAALGSCGIEKAEAFGRLLAKNAVRPVHIDDIISDLHF